MDEAEERLRKKLVKLPGKWAELRPDEVEPINVPGYLVVLKRCACRAAGPDLIYQGNMASVFPVHHHYVKVSRKLWRDVSEARGWPQSAYTVEAFIERWRP